MLGLSDSLALGLGHVSLHHLVDVVLVLEIGRGLIVVVGSVLLQEVAA